MNDAESTYQELLCPSCLGSWVEPDEEESPWWNCEECGWTGKPDDLLALDEDGQIQPNEEMKTATTALGDRLFGVVIQR
ncbi:hypothetical protein GFS31_24280 [Leptolyngbya sp. BL0902]|nr:hypothetical protein GFS31_24280 [Leptolyngbya sp. BL0902]